MLFPAAPLPVVDLSTGINPHSYPVSPLPATAFSRLPEPGDLFRLAAVAAQAYGAPSARHVAAAPGTQILLPLVARLVRPGRAAVLSPTYAEHRRTAALAGHQVAETSDLDRLAEADLAVVVNPNNPDGRLVTAADLLAIANQLARRDGLLVVDEAFMDVGPVAESLAAHAGHHGIVVLRSFGKFFGLPGVRLGFAIADPHRAAAVAGELGPWAVSGPALADGLEALADRSWHVAMRRKLAREAARLDGLLSARQIAVTGGTILYRTVEHDDAARLFDTLGRRGILTRRFADNHRRLRFGLPGDAAAWQRLDLALDAWQAAAPTTKSA